MKLNDLKFLQNSRSPQTIAWRRKVADSTNAKPYKLKYFDDIDYYRMVDWDYLCSLLLKVK